MSENNKQEQNISKLEEAFERAIKSGQFVIWCQPKYDTNTQAMVAGEALVRWQTETGEIIRPSEFIPVFEANGCIERLDEYIFEKVCEYQKDLLEQNLIPVPVSVNISRKSLSYPDKVERYTKITEKYNVPKRLVPIELTESATIDNEQIRKVTEDFRTAGFPLHMDDFGSGYSSMANLGSLGFDVIKLDKSLIDEIGTPNGDEIVRHIIELSHSCNMKVVAEGVEYRAQYTFLKKCGCETIQGYYFCKPIPFTEFMELQQKTTVQKNNSSAPFKEIKNSNATDVDYSEYVGLKRLIVKKISPAKLAKYKKFDYKGERNSIYKANRFAMRCMGYSLLVLFGSWILDILNVFIVDINIMNTAVISGSIVYGLTHVYARIAGLDKPNSRYAVITGLILMYTVIFMQMSYHTTMVMLFPMICSMLYFDRKLTRFTFIVTCLGVATAVMIGYRIGLCDANMLLLTYTTSKVHMALLQAGDFTVNSNNFLIFLFFVIPKWGIMWAIMPLLNRLSKDIQSKTKKEEKIKQIAERDGLTGVHNRYKYVQDINNYYPSMDKVAVLYYDINNLKAVNDSKGHECGDKLICALSETLLKYESDSCRNYRIGGDEFVTIFGKDGVARIDQIKSDIMDTLALKAPEDNVDLSVAIGLAIGSGSDIENVINMADADMYKNKFAMKNGL